MSDRPRRGESTSAKARRDPPQDSRYRPGVGLMLLNREGKVLVAQRIDMASAAWQMPQGGIDKGESPLAAAWRELKEEISTDAAELIAESRGWLRYDLPAEVATRRWRGRYRGQTQKWFVLRFHGRDDDIDIATEKPEFSDWKWADMAELPELIVPFKRALYRRLIDEFGHLGGGAPAGS
jgi:putative (di)nucleoside polyphosphate hydrolase